jgi:hypothetical protein
MKFVVASAIAALAAATPLTTMDMEFIKFVAEYGRSYGTQEEFNFRAGHFAQNLMKIRALNETTSTHGINKFTDRTPAEMKKLLGYRAQDMSFRNVVDFPTAQVDTVNWFAKGAITPVKD